MICPLYEIITVGMISLLRTTTRTMIFMALYLTLIGIICAVNQIYYQLKDPNLLGLILGPLNRTGIPIKSVLVFEVYRSAVDVWLLFYLSSIFQTSFFNFLFGLSQVTQRLDSHCSPNLNEPDPNNKIIFNF